MATEDEGLPPPAVPGPASPGPGEVGEGTKSRGSDAEYRCDLCSAPMVEWHCRIICTFCGYQRDCSDP